MSSRFGDLRHARSPARIARGSGVRRTLKRLGPYLLLIPAFVTIGTFTYRPVFYSLYLSLMDWQLGAGPKVLVGFDNYLRLFRAPEFWNALRNTFLYAGVVGGVSITLGLVLALAAHRLERFQAVYQTVFFLPVASTMAAMAVVWSFMFDANIGVVNAALSSLGFSPVDWLNDPSTALAAVMTVGIWGSTGYAMVLFLAGLTAIPKELHEAAAIDGASATDQFRFITWPLLTPTTLFVLVVMTIRSMEAFDGVKILTDGGPLGSTQVLSHLLYQVGFQYFDTGYAASLAVVFFVLLVALALLQVRVLERRVHYQ